MRAAVTNVAVGELIGVSHAQVSRIRAGQRLPSIPTMLRIEAEFGWKIEGQVQTRSLPNLYAETFEDFLVERYGVAETVDA